MDEAIIHSIIDIYFEDSHDKINKNENLKEYYSNFNKKELQSVLGAYLLMKNDVMYLGEVPYQTEHTKEEMVCYLIEHCKDIYQTALYTIDDKSLKQWQKLIKKKGYCNMIADANHLEYSIHFIEQLKKLKLAKINYQSDKGRIEFLVPKELLKMVQEIIQKKEFKEKRRYINIIYSNTTKILKAYGLLSINKLHEIMNLVFMKIEKSELEIYLKMICVLNDNLHWFGDGDESLITDVGFEDEDEVYTYYYSLDDGDYKIFTKEEYEELEKGTYHQKFEIYDDLIDYLSMEMELDDQALESFEDWFILDYLSSYQRDVDQANKNLIVNLEKFFPNLKVQDKIIIKKKLSSLGKLYPLYSLKGYAREEDKIMISMS